MKNNFQKKDKQGKKRIFSGSRFCNLAKRLEHRNIKGRQPKKLKA